MSSFSVQAFSYLKQTSPYNTLGFRWPINREVPSSVKRLSISEFVTAIELAAYTVESMHTRSNSAQFDELLKQSLEAQYEKYEASMKKVDDEKKEIESTFQKDLTFKTEQFERHVGFLTNQISELQAALRASETSYDLLKKQIETIRSESSSFYDTALKKVMEQKEIDLKRILETKESAFASEMMRKEAAVAAEIERIQTLTAATIQNEKERLAIEWDRLAAEKQELIKKTSSSSVSKGQVGESTIDSLVAEYTSWGVLENTSKTSHGTDRSGTIRDCKVLFEVKNYSNDVPSDELKKFYRDMEEHNDWPLGVFISMNTDIHTRKHKGFIQLEWTRSSQMLLLIQRFHDHNPRDLLAFIDMCADIAVDVYRARSVSDQTETLNYQKRIDQAKLYVEKECKRIGDLLKQMNVDRRNLIDMIDRQHSNYKYNMEQCKTALLSVVSILLNSIETVETTEQKGGEVETEPISEAIQMPVNIPDVSSNTTVAPVKKAGRKKKDAQSSV